MKQIIYSVILAFVSTKLFVYAIIEQTCKLNGADQALNTQYISKLSDGTCSESDTNQNITYCLIDQYCLQKTPTIKCINLITSSTYTGYNTDTQECIQETYTDIDTNKIKCKDSGACKAQISGSYSCKLLKLDTDFEIETLPPNNVCGKIIDNSDAKCISKISNSTYNYYILNKECAPGYVCKNSNNKCQKFKQERYSGTNTVVGTKQDGGCIEPATLNDLQTYQAQVCGYDFCLTPQGYCTQLNTIRQIGREQTTTNCIDIGTSGKIADSCAKGYCLYQGNCIQVTITNELNLKVNNSDTSNTDVLAIGSSLTEFNQCIFQQIDKSKIKDPQAQIQDSTTNYFIGDPLIISPTSKAEFCDFQLYCLNPLDNKCKKIDSTTIKCKDSQNQCSSTSCSTCRFDQCLNTSHQCVDLKNTSNSSSPYCASQGGACNSVQESSCIQCPQGYCYDSTSSSAKCILMSDVSVQSNQCLINRYGYIACQYVDMNAKKQQSPKEELFCADNQNACTLIFKGLNVSTPNNLCLRCPDSYKNPGNKICYEDNSNSGGSSGGSTDELLSLEPEIEYYDKQANLLYDQTPGSFCFYKKDGVCSMCQNKYFLRGGICVKCPLSTDINGLNMISSNVQDYYQNVYLSDYKSLFPYKAPDTQQLQFECNDCVMNTLEWASNLTGTFLNCKQFIFSYNQLAQTTPLMSYLQSFKLNGGQVSKYEPTTDKPQNCKDIAVQSDNGKSICQVCEEKYTLDHKDGKCKPCPTNCKNCYYGGLYEGQMVNWSSPPDNLKNIDFATLTGSNMYTMLCNACLQSVGYTLDKTFTDCEQCAENCDYCYWGNTSFNLTSKNTIYSDNYLKELGLKKKCVQCKLGYVFDKSLSEQKCIKQITNCQQSAFLNSNGQPLTIHPWFSETDIQGDLQCLLCQYKQGYYAEKQYNTCILQSSPPSPITSSCQAYIQQTKECQLCDSLNYLNLSNNNQCIPQQCSTLVYDCQRCYSYQDVTSTPNVQIYQCLECSTASKVPSINGCVDCPTGCSSCYEGNSQLNFTSHLLYVRPKLSLQDRLFYQSQFDTKFICTSCQNGYVLDVVEQTCVYKDCGSNCAKCDYSQPTPQCQVCNITNLIQPIQNLIGYIGQFYFKQSNFDYSLFASFTNDKTDCQLCPIWCNSCDPVSIGSDPFNLFNSKCHSCKDNYSQVTGSVDKLMVFDRNRGKCYFCPKQITQNSIPTQIQNCHYKKEIVIKLKCLSISDPTKDSNNIYNLARGNEINWDAEILASTDLNTAFVTYNELAVREISVEFQIQGDSGKCTLNSKIVISSQIANQVKSLQTYKVNIVGINNPANPDNSQVKLELNGLLVFEGFQQIAMKNFQVIPTNEESVKQYGLQFSSTQIEQVLFENMSFTRTKLGSISSALNIQFNNLYQNLTLSNVNFDFIYMWKQNIIQTSYDIQQTMNGAINIQLSNVNFNNIYLDSCNFISIQVAQTNINMVNINLKNSNLINGAQLLQYNMASSTSTVGIIMQNFVMENITLSSSSYIFQMSQLASWYANKIRITKSTFIDTIYNAAVFVANGANINDLIIEQSVFQNYCFLTTPSVISSNNLYNPGSLFMISNVLFQKNNINVPGTILINLQGYSVSQYNIGLKSISIPTGNTFSLEPDGQNLISISTFNTIDLQNILIQDYINTDSITVNSVQHITFSNINCLGTQYDKYVNSCIQLTDFHNTAIFKSILLSNFKSQASQIKIQMQIDVSQTQDTGVFFQNITMTEVFLYQDLAFENLAGLFYYSTSSVPIQMQKINITNNTLDAQGKKIYGESSSGIFIDSFLSSVSVVDSIFQQNTALQSKNSLSILSMNVSVSNTVFKEGNKYISDNDILNEIQGGLFYVKSSYLLVDACTFSNSRAQSGALYWQALGNASATIQNNILQNNTASFSSLKSQGGAFYTETQYADQITLDIKNNQFINNYAIYDGAAIFIQNFKKKAYIKLIFNTFIDNFSSNGACLNALLHENSMSEIDISMNYFSFQPGSVSTITYINNQLEASDRLQNGFIALQGFNKTRLEQNEFYLDVFPKDYDFILSSSDLQQIVFQSWILLMKSQYLVDLASKFISSTIGQPLIVTSQLTQIQLINTVIQNLKSFYDKFVLIAQDKQLMTSTSLIHISAQGAEFIGLQSQNLVCTKCNLGNIYVESFILNIRSSLFQQNSANQGAGLYLAKLIGASTSYKSISQDIKSSNFYGSSRILQDGPVDKKNRQLDSPVLDLNTGSRKIESCQFLYNTAVNGGAIYIDTIQIDIINTEFLQNSASNYGGAIYYNFQANQNVAQNQFLAYRSQFVRNSANVGGAIYSKGNIIKTDDKNPQNQNTYIQNIGKLFGSDKIQNPTGFQVLSNNTVYKDKFVLKSHNSGPIQSEILVQFINEAGEVYSQADPNSEISLNIQLIASQQQNGLVNPNSLPFTNNYFNLTSAVSVIGKFEQNLQIQLTSPYIMIPVYDQISGNVSSYTSSYIFNLNVNVRSCQAGEEQQVIEERYDTCVPCISPTYNLQENDQCKKCPLADAVCEGKTILLPPGYWRFNSSSDEILECINLKENCVGDINRVDSSAIIRSYQNQYCYEGHVGLRCEDCDIQGKYWPKSFSKAGKFKCSDCTQVSGNMFKLLIIQFGTIILTGFFVKSTIDLIQKKILLKYLPKLFLQQSTSGRNQNYQIYLTNITSRKQQQQGESDAFSSIFQYSASPVENSMMAQDCFLVQIIDTFMDKNDMLYFRIIVGQMQVILTFFLFYISFLAVAQILRWKTSSAVIFCALNYIFISNQPGIFNMIVGSFSCTNTKTASFVKDYVQYQCDSQHTLWKYSLMLPLILIWALFIPAGQYYILRKASKTPKFDVFEKRYDIEERKRLIESEKTVVDRSTVFQKETMLDSLKIRYALGFIYLEYRKDTFYWETIKIFEKMLIIFVLNMYDSEIKLKGILCFIIIFGYGLISLKYRPYQREQLNSVDFWSSNICALSLVLGVMLSSADSNQIIQYLGYGFIILINLIFVLWIVKIILSAYLEEFDELVNKAKIFLCKMYPSLKPILKPKEFDPKKIKDVWDCLKHAISEYSKTKQNQIQNNNLKTRPDDTQDHNPLLMQFTYPYRGGRVEIHDINQEEEERKNQLENVEQDKNMTYGNSQYGDEKIRSKQISDIKKLYVKPKINPGQNYEQLYYQELKAAFKDVELMNILKIKERHIRIDYDLQAEYQNDKALKSTLQIKKGKLEKKLNELKNDYKDNKELVDYFQALQNEIQEKFNLNQDNSYLKEIDAYFTYYQKIINFQIKIIQLDDKTKVLFKLEHQNHNSSDIADYFKELIKEKQNFEEAKLDRNEFEFYLNLFDTYLELKQKAEDILSKYQDNQLANELIRSKNAFLSSYASAYNNKQLTKKAKEQFEKQLQAQMQQIDNFLKANPLNSRFSSDGSGYGSNGSQQSPSSGERIIELQNFHNSK